MLTSALILIARLVLDIIWLILASISFVIPDGIGETWSEFFAYTHTLDGIFPMETVLLCLTTILIVLAIRYAIDIVLWIAALLPIIGTKTQAKLPKVHT